ncbi:flagellar biosynthetic protein FliQ [Segeticoccus rhizosphaerae]|nr:flagellar biosynthetic protein FliQ [Segeticoccus rhizosphaerae]
MTDALVVEIARMTAVVCVKLAGRVLLVSLVIGVLVSLFQAIF